MDALDLIQAAERAELVDADGDRVELELSPGLSAAEIDAFARGLPCSLPASMRRVLAHCAGVAGLGVDLVDFTGREMSHSREELFPHGLPIAEDGFGNFWVVDLQPTSIDWAPIYFVSHDAPVILLQSRSLEHFLEELTKMVRPPHRSAIDDVHEDRPFEIWRQNPGVLSRQACLDSADAVMSDFAKELEPGFEIVDLRRAEIGFGFSWGRYGPRTTVKRFGALPVFAYRAPPRKSIFQRIFG
jgi:cell wall assembly regulator SMI1